MKKFLLLVLLLGFMLGLVGCIKNVDTMYLQGIMVDQIFYEKSYQPMSSEVDESAIIGYIESYTDSYPKKDNQTNISKELIGAPYARVEGGIAILYKTEWYLCIAETTD